jgi:endonuclease/exonuclease/phosphatase family metal-dependent hydrolase
MPYLLRAMTWNIAEGWLDHQQPRNSQLPIIADRIRAQFPDFVLLNEVVNWGPFGGGVHLVRELMRLTSLPYAQWADTVALGWSGHKAVAVLSRQPLDTVSYEPFGSGYGMVGTRTAVDGVSLHLWSLRLNAYSEPEQIASLGLITKVIARVPVSDAVIIAGDFNCTYRRLILCSSCGTQDFATRSTRSPTLIRAAAPELL